MSHEPSRSIEEPAQDLLESRALELARAEGREQIETCDLQEARREILGPSASTEAPDPPESVLDNPSESSDRPEQPRDRRVESSESDGGRTK